MDFMFFFFFFFSSSGSEWGEMLDFPEIIVCKRRSKSKSDHRLEIFLREEMALFREKKKNR
jgi:hypothetical protein